jgi:hypothetical protein
MALLQRFLENLLPAEPLFPAPSTQNPEPEPDYGVDGWEGFSRARAEVLRPTADTW